MFYCNQDSIQADSGSKWQNSYGMTDCHRIPSYSWETKDYGTRNFTTGHSLTSKGHTLKVARVEVVQRGHACAPCALQVGAQSAQASHGGALHPLPLLP